MKASLRRIRPPPPSSRKVTKKSLQLAMSSSTSARTDNALHHAPASSSHNALTMILASGLAAVAAGAVSFTDSKNEATTEESSNSLSQSSSNANNAVTNGRAVAMAAHPKTGGQPIRSSSSSLQLQTNNNQIMPLLATSSSSSGGLLLATSDASAERSASLAAVARLSGASSKSSPPPFSVKPKQIMTNNNDNPSIGAIDGVIQKSAASEHNQKKSTTIANSFRNTAEGKIDNNNSGDGDSDNSGGNNNNNEDNNQSSSSPPREDLDDDDSYPTFTPYHHSLLKKYLTPEIWSKLSTLRTSHGTTIEDIIRAGLALPIGANPPRRVGVLVGDAECYAVFRELLDPIISEYHGIENYEEWADPELPMESHFAARPMFRGEQQQRGATTTPAGSSSGSGGGSGSVPVANNNDDDDDDFGVIKSSGADEDSDENDDSSFLLDEEDDVFVEYVALPSSTLSSPAAPSSSSSLSSSTSTLQSTSSSSSTSSSARHVAAIASKRKGQLRRHPTIINNPRLVTNREADPDGRYILSTRIRVARSLDGVKFPTTMSRSDRRRVQRLVGECALHFSSPNLSHGTYTPVLGMTNDQNLDLIERHVLFDNPNEWTIASGLGRDWPDGRALYANVADLQSSTPDFMIWVNEEDHLRIMCLRSGGDIQGVFTTLMNGVRELERELRKRGWHFAYDPRLGYLTSCPTNVGTTMRASVHVRLTNLGRLPGFFRLVERLKLEARGKYGETDRHYTGVFDISNAERLGKSEVHLINVMVEGVARLIELERRLEDGETIDIDEIA